MTLAVDLPCHVYGYVDRRMLSAGQRDGWEPAVWFGITVPRNRAIGLSVLLENGALYRCLPPHAWAFRVDAGSWEVAQAQAWDCFGGAAQVLEYAYLRELTVQVIRTQDRGSYLFTLEFGEDGFSRYPAQSKCLHAIELEHGRLTWQPNDRVVFHDASFTVAGADVSWLRRQTTVWGVEDWPQQAGP